MVLPASQLWGSTWEPRDQPSLLREPQSSQRDPHIEAGRAPHRRSRGGQPSRPVAKLQVRLPTPGNTRRAGAISRSRAPERQPPAPALPRPGDALGAHPASPVSAPPVSAPASCRSSSRWLRRSRLALPPDPPPALQSRGLGSGRPAPGRYLAGAEPAHLSSAPRPVPPQFRIRPRAYLPLVHLKLPHPPPPRLRPRSSEPGPLRAQVHLKHLPGPAPPAHPSSAPGPASGPGPPHQPLLAPTTS